MSVQATRSAGIAGSVGFLLIGWSGLLVPSLIRSIEVSFAQSDAGMGLYYLVYAIAYASGSLVGGMATERLGRRKVLGAAASLHGAGFLILGTAPVWTIFLAAAIPTGFGAGALDGGINGLFLDLYRSGRGRALNLLHTVFGVGALSAPIVVGRLIEAGVGYGPIIAATGLAAVAVGSAFVVVRMPSGRHERRGPIAVGAGAVPGLGVIDRAAVGIRGIRERMAGPVVLLAIAIGCYVAGEIGVSSWLVRFLEPAPLGVATTALSLFWGGLALGRLVAARFSDRFDHTLFAIATAVATGVALVGAVLVPSLPVSIALFALTGFATGPVFPMIIALGGDRYPERSAAVSGFLAGAAVTGSIIYPPVMGFLSVTVGLQIAMLGNVALAFACAFALVLSGRSSREAQAGTTAS